jgi:NodT family efflux transporter outer membrane factor (OMF) lipoprotein
LASLAIALAGCMSLAPNYQRPPAPVPDRFAAAGPDAAGTAAADLAWEQVFAEPRLKRLIEIALANNRDLRVAVLNIEQAHARTQAQRASLLPTVNVGASASRQPTVSGGSATTYNTYSVGALVTSYELDLFGRVHALSDAALASELASVQARKTAQISLVAAVAGQYLNRVADDELLALTQQTLHTREESLRLVQLKFDLGATSELDLQQALSLVENARATLAQVQRQREVDDNALALLLGQPIPADLPPPPALGAIFMGPELPAGLPSHLLDRRPDIRQAEAQLIAAHANIGAARAAMYPLITLTGSAGTLSSELSGLFKSGSWVWGLAPQLLWTVFDSGRNEANLQIAQAGREIALAQYDKAIQSAFREVADALAGRATLTDQLRAQRAQTEADAARLRIADLRYRNGVASHLDLLDAQRSLFATQQQTLLVQLAQLQNQVTLYKALGGGWSEPATGTAAAQRR